MSTQERTEVIAGLHELLDFLAEHPVIPLGAFTYHGYGCYPMNAPGGQDVESALEVLRAIGASIGIEPTVPYGRHVIVRGPTFRGGVRFDATVCDAEELFRQQETSRAGDPDLTPEVPAVATTRPGNTSVTHGEGEVAGLSGWVGPATAPADGALPRLVHPAPIQDPALADRPDGA